MVEARAGEKAVGGGDRYRYMCGLERENESRPDGPAVAGTRDSFGCSYRTGSSLVMSATSRYAPEADTAARPSLRPEGAKDRIERMTSSAEYEPSAPGSRLRIKL